MLLLLLAIYLLTSPLLGRLFYPFHYREQIEAAGEKYRVDPLLIAALIKVESGFRREAVSSQGARGLMQIMPETAEWVAGKIGYRDFSPELLFQPEINIELGTYYLADLLQLFQGNRVVALAAYNGGRGKVGRWLEEGVWDGRLENLEQIPYRETRDFVYRVLQAYARYRQDDGNR